MKVVIIEDELPARTMLISFLQKFDTTIEITGILDSVKASKSFLSNASPDLIFADIELLDGTVFTLFNEIKINAPVIFTTSYDSFLMDAFTTNGIAYLLKPFNYPQFKSAMEKYKLLVTPNTTQAQVKILQKVFKAKDYKKRFVSRVKDTLYLIETNDIVCFKAEDGIIRAFTETGKSFILIETVLKGIEESLDPQVFYKVNRSEIVNINFIQKVKKYDRDRLAIYVKGVSKTIITSSRITSNFRSWLNA